MVQWPAVAWLRGMSIRYQVVLGVAVGVAFVTVAFGLLMTYTLQRAIDAAKNERLDQAQLVAARVDALAGRAGGQRENSPELLSLLGGLTKVVATIIDEKGNIISTSGESEVTGPKPHFQFVADLVGERRAGVRIHEIAGGSHIVAFSPTESAGGGALVVEELEDGALSFLAKLLRILPFFGIGVLVMTTVSAWLHAHYAVRPLVQLERAAARIAGGRLDEPVTTGRRDEIGRLAQSFDTMRHELKAANDARLQWEQHLEQRVRERTLEVHRLVGRVINAQEEERRRCAQELHDDTAQALAAVLLRMEALRDSLPPDQTQVRQQIEPTLTQGARALEDLRRVIRGLRPAALDDLGLVAALRSHAGTALAASGVRLDFSVQGEEQRLPRAAEVALFRILQEAVNNVARHANATNTTVRLSFRNALFAATVEDDGQGFDLAQALARGTGLGLQGMRERADIVNARLEVTSAPGQGTAVNVELRLGEDMDAEA